MSYMCIKIKIKLDLRGLKPAPGHSVKEEDLLTQVEKSPEPLPHSYTVALLPIRTTWAGS
uniref:Uncharacterized protein n=1 Tax=Arundo donax TaxID=35708 RepID=A0A0A9BJ36_ARUDO